MPQTPLLWRWVENCPDTLSPSRGSPSLLLPFERVEVGVQPMLEEVTLCPLHAQSVHHVTLQWGTWHQLLSAFGTSAKMERLTLKKAAHLISCYSDSNVVGVVTNRTRSIPADSAHFSFLCVCVLLIQNSDYLSAEVTKHTTAWN